MKKIKMIEKKRKRARRKFGIRKKIMGTAERPRMTVYKSNRYTYIQVIDDIKGQTIAAASNLEKELRNIKNTVEQAGKLGEQIGLRLKKKKIKKVVFDRNGYPYHGKIKVIADGARKSGIEF